MSLLNRLISVCSVCLILTLSINSYVIKGEKENINNPPWPIYKGNAQHTGLSPFSTISNTGILRWVYQLEENVNNIVIDGEGTIYFMDTYNITLHAINPDGSLKWELVLDTGPESVKTNPVIGKDGNIYIASRSLISSNLDFLYSIHPNGTIAWKHSSVGAVPNSPVISEEGIIYLKTIDNDDTTRIIAIFLNGTLKWEYTLNNDTSYTSPVIDKNNVIYFTNDEHLYAIFSNNSSKWKTPIMRYSSSPTIGDDGVIYLVNGNSPDGDGNQVFAILPNGTLKWKINIGTTHYSYIGPSIDKNGNIYVSGNQSIFSINNVGKINWEFKVGSEITSPISISIDGMIYFSSSSGSFFSLFSNGSLNWQRMISPRVFQTAAIGFDGSIYIVGTCSNNKNCLYCYGGNDTEPFPPQNLMAIPGDGYVFLQWNEPNFIGASPIIEYRIYKGQKSGCEEHSQTILGKETSFIDTDVENGNTFFYYITAINEFGESYPSKEIQAIPLNTLKDNIKPEIVILSPENDTISKEKEITISGVAKDNIGIQRIEVSFNGKEWTIVNGTTSWSSNLKLKDGKNEIFVKATDISGNYQTSSIVVSHSPSTNNTNVEVSILIVFLILVVLILLLIWIFR